MIKRILVVLGGSRFMESVIETAIELAERHGATLTGCAVVDSALVDPGEAVPVGAGGVAREAREERMGIARTGALEATHRFAEACEARGVAHTTEVLEGDAVERLREAWRFQDVGLIGIREIFSYGAVDHDPDVVVRLINHGVRPLIAIDSRSTRMERVLVAFNGSLESCKALKQWTMVHAGPGVSVRVVTCGEECPEADLLEAAAYVRDHGVERVETARLEGGPETALLEDGEAWGADLLVCGSTGRNWLSRMVIGDTARSLVENSSLPLFLLH